MRLSLSREGTRIHTLLRSRIGELAGQAAQGFSDEERRTRIGLLDRIGANLEPPSESRG